MKPILIHKGDSTVFANVNKFLTFNLETDLDLTGWTAKFVLGWITKEIADISSKTFEIILSASETNKLLSGTMHGSVILTDSDGNIKTIVNKIPFEITSQVVENKYQEIDLTIPESSGVDIKLKVGASYVTSVNGMTGDVYLNIPSIEGLATEQQLAQGLDAKQDKGDYALVEDIPTQVSELENDVNYATQTQVLQAIASIPQFSLSIVNELPATGEKMTLYLVPKEGTNNDVYDEYIWIEQTSSFEFLGTTAVDLTDYVKNTDYATTDKAGVIKTTASYGLAVSSTTGILYGSTKSLALYNSANDVCVVCKGTLENVLAQYKKCSDPMTQSDYEALETKDANTLYLIEEE